MRTRILWKLLLTNILPVIGVVFLIVWVAIDTLAAKYFMDLMEIYDVSPDEIHRMFLSSIHYYLVWAGLAALALAFVLSYLLTRRVLRPLSQMAAVTRAVAAGNYAARVDVSTDDEVGQLGRAFNRMADSLERMERLRKTMVADVAHELRTPLTNLRGYLEGLNDGVIEPVPETFHLLQQENLRLVHLVDDLQRLARADAARAYLRRETVDLVGLVEQEVVALYRPNFQEKNITVTIHAPEALAVEADADKISQAIRNLADNCWNYTPANGRVGVGIRRVDEGIEVAFTNSGPGIAAEDLPHIFERFFRADRSRSRLIGGAGIGLAITQELVEAHGGQVGAESVAGETRVWFLLPG